MLFGKNILDIIIIATLFFCTIRSFFKGTIHEIFSLLALVMGIFLARRFYHPIAQSLGREGSLIAATLAFIILFLAVYITIIIFGKLLRHVIKSVELGWLDHLGGALLGFIKGCFLACLLAGILILILPSESRLIQTSRLTPLLYRTSSLLLKFAPPAVKQRFRRKIEELEGGKGKKTSSPKHTPGKGRIFIFSFLYQKRLDYSKTLTSFAIFNRPAGVLSVSAFYLPHR
jgi:membrane protein required for colicin V production